MLHIIKSINFEAVLNKDENEILKLKKYTNFLDHAMPYISALRPSKNEEGKYSFKSLVPQLKSGEFEVQGDVVTGEFIGQIVRTIGSFNRSDISPLAQTTRTDISSGVPLALKAFRLAYDIKYSDWDYSDTRLAEVFLGKGLEGLTTCEIPDFSTEDLKELRDSAITFRKTGAKQSLTGYKLNLTGVPKFDSLPKCVRFMLIQTWIWSPSLRSPFMITDPRNFDVLSEPLEKVDSSLLDPRLKKTQLECPW